MPSPARRLGAIVGGLYASGMSAAELDAALRSIDWTNLFSSRVDRQHLSQRRKDEDFEISSVIEFGVRDGELRAPVGAVSSRGLETLLRRYTLPVRQVREFDRLPIPFRAVATDLETGAAVVLEQGDLALALRSSMSVPGVFPPPRFRAGSSATAATSTTYRSMLRAPSAWTSSSSSTSARPWPAATR
jgi:NTE family protein